MNILTKMPENKTSQTTTERPTRVNFSTPPANILETADGYVLQAEMPGVCKDGLEVTVENGELAISGRRTKFAAPGKELYRESRALDYRRVFELDPSIDASKITAKIEQGLLTLHLPKTEAVKPHRVQVTD